MYALDFWLAVAVLAAVPFWMAAYGGHVAAETISDSRHRFYVRLKFWSIGLLGLIVAFVYQYRVTKSDESKQQATEMWQKSVTSELMGIRDNPAYSKEQKQAASKLQRQVDQGPKPPVVSAAQMRAIKEIDQFIAEPDEMALRKEFGFPEMMESNIRSVINNLRRYKRTGVKSHYDLPPGETLIDSRFAKGHIERYGGGFKMDIDDTTVYFIVLPSAYVSSKARLVIIKNSTELPTIILDSVKNFDSVIQQNATHLIEVLSAAMDENQDLYLEYDNSSSPMFHKLDALYLDTFIQLRPEADKVRDATRRYLRIK